MSQAAAEAGLPCRSLLGTQIAPEDVGGIPRIVGERSVFCPPRVLLPKDKTARWFVLHAIRLGIYNDNVRNLLAPESTNAFLKALGAEERAAVLLGNVQRWGELGADDAILATLKEITGIE